MIHLVYGGSGSGKSEYAEKLVLNINSPQKIYLATMKNYGKENMLKIKRHKELRKDKGFITVEQETLNLSFNLNSLLQEKKSTILIECISNLVANEMFQDKKNISTNKVIEKICNDFLKIKNQIESIIIVTNNVFEDGILYDENTKNYIKALGEINIFLANLADKATEVICGIPIKIK